MVESSTLLAFAGVAFAMVIAPGPNMAYLVSRSISQGRTAGLVSLLGVVTGFLVYLVLAALGVTALLFAVPYAYDTLRLAGAAYLGWLAWQSLRPGGSSPFETRALAPDSPRRLYAMGLLTNLLNPKAALIYLSLLPQFIDPARGDVFAQSLVLGLVQIGVSASVNATLVCAAGAVAGVLARRPRLARVQRGATGLVLGAFALRMALDARR